MEEGTVNSKIECHSKVALSNENLQQFAYSASHDLQEPIRNVAYHNVLDADVQLFLRFQKEGGRRLATLVNDLLAYTRAGTAELNEAPVDSTAVLKHSPASLAEAIRDSKAAVTFDDLPEVYIGEAHLQQVLQNLSGNALKYRDETPPQIHISAVGQSAVWRFSVQDNGIGIDPQLKKKIYGIFTQLHHDRTYAGPASDWLFASALLNAMEEESGSNPNRGKEQPSSSPSADALKQSVSPRWTLLLAEDNLTDAILVREAIRMETCLSEVHVAPDGQQGFSLLPERSGIRTLPARSFCCSI